MPASQTFCPECAATIEPEAVSVGKPTTCPTCGHRFLAEKTSAPARPRPRKARSAPAITMPPPEVMLRRDSASRGSWIDGLRYLVLRNSPLVVLGGGLLLLAMIVAVGFSSSSRGSLDGQQASIHGYLPRGTGSAVPSARSGKSGGSLSTVRRDKAASPARPLKSGPGQSQPAAVKEEAIRIAAAELMQLFRDDAMAAGARFRLKTLEVTGVVARLAQNGGALEVALHGPEGTRGVLCSGFAMAGAVERSIMPGNKVTIRGLFLGIANSEFVALARCELLEAPNEAPRAAF